MPGGYRARGWAGLIAALIVAVPLWAITTTQSGFSYVELVVFTGPAVVLAVSASWAARAFRRDGWSWVRAARAAVGGALLLPPAIAGGIAFFSAWNGSAVLLTFVVAAWLALGAGVLVAAVRALWADVSQSRRGGSARLVLLRPTQATRARRSPARVGPRPRWAEYQPPRQPTESRERPSA